MKKINLKVLGIILVILVIILFLVFRLAIKNNMLKFMSDDSRQIALMSDIYTFVLDTELEDKKISLTEDTSLYINYITYNHYVISQSNEISEILSNYSSSDAEYSYTLSTSFNVKKMILTVTLSANDKKDDVIYTFKLSTDKKNDKITYEIKNVEYEIE